LAAVTAVQRRATPVRLSLPQGREQVLPVQARLQVSPVQGPLLASPVQGRPQVSPVPEPMQVLQVRALVSPV